MTLLVSFNITAFIAQLFPLNGLNSHRVDVSLKSRYDDQSEMDDDDDIDHRTEHGDQDEACRGISSEFYFCYLFLFYLCRGLVIQ